MKKTILFLFAVAVQTTLFAQKYFPEGTKWTEIRLDTVKYDGWYSLTGDEWVPNFEAIEYYVKGEYVKAPWDKSDVFICVYTNGLEWSDSLTFLVNEGFEGNDCVMMVVPTFYDGRLQIISPTLVYQFRWEVGLRLYCQNILGANCDCIPAEGIHEFGTITEIKEGKFGGARPLKYVEMNGVRIIQGIGVTEWNDGECLFGPVQPFQFMSGMNGGGDDEARHYRSMLVHFERGGEVLYDVWPEKGGNGIGGIPNAECETDDALYDLSGRRVTEPRKGVYIQHGRKRVK